MGETTAAPTPATSAERPWPVRTVSAKVASWIGRLGEVWVEGQVAQLTRRPGAKTVFLTLRDPAADISLTVSCRRDVLDSVRPELAEGARIVARARPDFYAGRGTFSLRAAEIRPVGVGELLARLERLRELLEAEGLFAAARKRALPFLPRQIGLVTGRASAARRDVEENARARWPGISFRTIEVPVQGPEAATSVCAALLELDRDPEVEVVVLARGGGSVEDLLPFSDETLCRAVARCVTPVVSAVGHEQDRPLVDLVADVRASTPTDAAKRIVPDLAEEALGLDSARRRLRGAVSRRIEAEFGWLADVRDRPALARPHLLLDAQTEQVLRERDRARRHVSRLIEAAGTDTGHLIARVRTLSPAATLERGYAVVRRVAPHTGALVRDPDQVADDERLEIRVAAGALPVRVDRAGTAPTTPTPRRRRRAARSTP